MILQVARMAWIAVSSIRISREVPQCSTRARLLATGAPRPARGDRRERADAYPINAKAALTRH